RALNHPFILTARADGVMNGTYDLTEGIRRLQAFEAAGADLLYIPIPPGPAELLQIIAAVRKPINALAAGPLQRCTVAALAAMGVRRISLGSQLARGAQSAVVNASRAILTDGHFQPLYANLPGAEIDALLPRKDR
ncbi:MAG: isocitrate lyase/phosphoenolpyruvate mutase family protein, partial [Pseudorhodobacter sp.]|nr:isocitrate lyase/phosphoenolpyruvate mutase family protein [Pseudorhodobacter sp.]